MQYYLAPLEGITTRIYRKVYHECFTPMDKYFTPFLSPHSKKGFSAKEKAEILPENNRGMRLVPQILTNKAKDFLQTEEKLADYGYDEINLNLGCPSKTVVSKGRGSGFLANPEELDRFLDEIFSGTKAQISIKTRIGRDDPEEFHRLLGIYNQYPLKELIIHPRVQKDFYKNKPNLEVFGEAAKANVCPLCYNGDIFSKENYHSIISRFPELGSMMFGRGILRYPGLIRFIKDRTVMKKHELLEFHNMIYESYRQHLYGDKTVLFKMKELWSYMIHSFEYDSRIEKRIKKAQKLIEYDDIIRELFSGYGLIL